VIPVTVADLPAVDPDARIVVADQHGRTYDIERADVAAAGAVLQLLCPEATSKPSVEDYECDHGLDIDEALEEARDVDLIEELRHRGYTVEKKTPAHDGTPVGGEAGGGAVSRVEGAGLKAGAGPENPPRPSGGAS
jgi:hypothetical protein